MKKIVFSVSLLFLASLLYAQPEIKVTKFEEVSASEAEDHSEIGKELLRTKKVYSWFDDDRDAHRAFYFLVYGDIYDNYKGGKNEYKYKEELYPLLKINHGYFAYVTYKNKKYLLFLIKRDVILSNPKSNQVLIHIYYE